MVLWHKATHVYPNIDFPTFSLAFINRYPNPFASHILSIDVLNVSRVQGSPQSNGTNNNTNNKNNNTTDQDTLKIVRLIKKSGKLPQWVKPFLGKINQSMIIEVLYINKNSELLQSYTKNLDHTKIIQVEEYTTYKYNSTTSSIDVNSNVKFTSGFNKHMHSESNTATTTTTTSSPTSSTTNTNTTNTSSISSYTNRFNIFNIDLSAKIETWSHSKFSENIKKTRKGMNYVLDQFASQGKYISTDLGHVGDTNPNVIVNDTKDL